MIKWFEFVLLYCYSLVFLVIWLPVELVDFKCNKGVRTKIDNDQKIKW